MKKGIIVLVVLLFMSTIFAYAESDTSIGHVEVVEQEYVWKNPDLSDDAVRYKVFILDEQKLYEQIKNEKILEAQNLSKKLGKEVLPKDPVIIKAENLEEIVEDKYGLYFREDRAFGKNVKIHINEFLNADAIIMDGLVLKNMRKVGKAADGGDIITFDYMYLVGSTMNKENPEFVRDLIPWIVLKTAKYPYYYYAFEKKAILGNKVVGSNERVVEIGKWYNNIKIGNTLKKPVKKSEVASLEGLPGIPYSMKEVEYFRISGTYVNSSPEKAAELIVLG